MARKVEQEKNIHFSWFMHSRPEYFWYAPPPLDFATTLWDGRDTNHDTDVVQPTLIFDADWHWLYSDAFYVVHSSRADAFWGRGTDALRKIACKDSGRMYPEKAIAHVADLAQCKVHRGISFGHSAWPDRDGHGGLWCHGFSPHSTSMLQACEAANEVSKQANAEYRQRSEAWLEKHTDADAHEEAMSSARGPQC
jgi:hypothetical protein